MVRRMRREDGTGTKEYLPSGKVRVRVRVDGKRRDRVCKDDAEADEYLLGVRALLDSGEASSRAPTLGEWGRSWLAGLMTRSAPADRSRWRTLIAPSPIAALELREIERPDVVAFVDWLCKQKRTETVAGAAPGGKKHAARKEKSDKPLSAQSRRHGLALLRRCLAAAADRGKIASNPALGVRLPRRDKEALRSQPWTYLEQEEIEQVVSGPLPELARLRYQVAIYTGLRQGDLWGLEWTHLDLKRGRLRKVIEKTGEPLDVPLLPPALAALQRLHQLAGEPKAGLVFPAPKGGRRGETDDGGWATRRKNGEAAPGHKELAGIERRVRFHDLRHTCATHLLAGTWGRRWTLEEVKEFLAHSSIVVTQRYVHAAGRLAEAAAATCGPRLVHAAPPPTVPPPSVGPVGLEPTTNGLKGPSISEGSQAVAPDDGPAMDQLARQIVERAAQGSIRPAEVEALARAVLHGRLVQLAQEALGGGEFACLAGLSLAMEIAGAGPALAARPGRRVGG